MKKSHIAVVVTLIGAVALIVMNGERAGRQDKEIVYAGSVVGEGYEAPRYFDALLGYRKIPKMPVKNLFYPQEKPEKASAGIVRDRPLVAPLIKPVVVAKPEKSAGTMPRLLGIVIRDNESKAFFAGDKFYTVSKGDTVAGRYRITAIQPEKVQVFDKSTGTRRTIRINQ